MHLDPDFSYLTYGDQGQRAKQIKAKVGSGDLLVFYSSLRDQNSRQLIYAIIGLFLVNTIALARQIPEQDWHQNAHTRRRLDISAEDIVIYGHPNSSGRLERCLPIGDVGPVLRQFLTRADNRFDGLVHLTVSHKLIRGQVPE